MKKITFLKTFIQTRWLHNFKSREALENYQKKQLSAYMDFLKRESPYFKNGVPNDFDHMDKAFMMTHFNELNTQGVDRDEALALAIESEKTRNFTELLGCPQGHLDTGDSLSQLKKREVCGQQLSWQRCCPRANFLGTA